MADLAFMAGLLGWFWLIGRLPAALFPEPRGAAASFAAPVLGFALFAVVASLLYRFGLSARQLFLAGSALAALGLVLALLRPPVRPVRGWAGTGAILAATVLLLLLPKWIGGPQFFVFQGNIWDQMSYLSRSVAYRAFTYGALMAADRTMPLANDFVLFARSELTERPGVSIVHAAVSSLAASPPSVNAYVFMAFLQLLGFFALGFVLVALGSAGPLLASFGAAAYALGFFSQYILDIDAWSELACLPVMLLAGAAALAALEPVGEGGAAPAAWRHAALAGLGLAGALYLYPECVPVYVAPLALVVLVAGRRRLDALLALSLAAVAAVLLAVPCWEGTMGVLFRQVHSAVSRSNDWFAYFQRYLMPLDLSPVFIAAYKSGHFPQGHLWQLALFVPIDLLAGLFGLYFLQPAPAWALPLRILWRLALLAALALLLGLGARALFRWLRRGLGPSGGRLALWTFLALPTPLPLLALGKLWAAGKAISMIGPFLFLTAAQPLLLPPEAGAARRRGAAALPALVYLLLELGFGLARPIAAGRPDGIHYASPPYPSVQVAAYKTTLSWDLARHDAALKACRRIALDVENPFLERYAELHLTELGAAWWSLRPLNSYFGIGIPLGMMTPLGTPDCLVTDHGAAAAGRERVISLAR